jgi:hypothetical protein
MATFTLTGDINELTGEDASRVTLVRVQSSHPLHDPATNVVYPLETLVPVTGGEFSVTLPSDASPAGYYFTVVANQIDAVWSVPAGATGATVDLSDADFAAYSPSRHAKAHGNVSGAVEVSANYGLHTMTLTGDTVLTPTGRFGQDIAVRAVTDGYDLTIDDAIWDAGAPPPLADPATITFLNFDPDGWVAFAVGAVIEPTEVTPHAPTFNIGAGTATIPTVTGVRYKIGGSTVTGTVSALEGFVTITAEPASSAYYFPVGADNEWSDTYPGWTVYVNDVFTGTDGAAIASRTAVPGPGSWPSGLDTDFRIATNMAYWDQHGENVFPLFDIPPTNAITVDQNVRFTVDYDLAQTPNGSAGLLGFIFRYNNAGVDQSTYINLTRAGDMFNSPGQVDLSISRDGAAAPTLTAEGGQSLTGQPSTGTVVCWNEGKVLKVSINGTLIATATSVQAIHNSTPGLKIGNRHVKMDTFKLEYYA